MPAKSSLTMAASSNPTMAELGDAVVSSTLKDTESCAAIRPGAATRAAPSHRCQR